MTSGQAFALPWPGRGTADLRGVSLSRRSRGCYPVSAGGLWLCSTFVLSLFHAVVVPSGFRTSVQPHRWITTWWWKKQSRTHSRVLVLPPFFLCLTWCTSHAEAGWLHPPAHRQCLSRRVTALRIPAGMVSLVADVQRQARAAEAGAELPAAQERRQPARTRQQVHSLADDRALEGLPRPRGVRAGRALPGASVAAGAAPLVPVSSPSAPSLMPGLCRGGGGGAGRGARTAGPARLGQC